MTDPQPFQFAPLRPLTREDASSGFRCEHEALNRFFQQQAGQQGRRDENRTWVLPRPDDQPDLPAVMGFSRFTSPRLSGAICRRT